MIDYKVYHVDSTGKFIGTHWVSAANDEEAMEIVREEAAPHDCEVWQGSRCIGIVSR